MFERRIVPTNGIIMGLCGIKGSGKLQYDVDGFEWEIVYCATSVESCTFYVTQSVGEYYKICTAAKFLFEINKIQNDNSIFYYI